jgi:hypothetical protein
MGVAKESSYFNDAQNIFPEIKQIVGKHSNTEN